MRNLTTALLTAALALPAWATTPEQGHGAEGAGGPFSGDLGSSLWTLVIFAVLLWVLGKYAWGPVLSGLQSRERFISDSLEQAQASRDQAEARLAEYEKRLAAARGEVETIMAEARRDAEALRHREEERAREEADRLLVRARREIDIATETAVKELYSRATRIATEAASRIIQRELRPEDHERLVADAVAAIERLPSH
jgi:F-type H+-transporting ATPase subunit b